MVKTKAKIIKTKAMILVWAKVLALILVLVW